MKTKQKSKKAMKNLISRLKWNSLEKVGKLLPYMLWSEFVSIQNYFGVSLHFMSCNFKKVHSEMLCRGKTDP